MRLKKLGKLLTSKFLLVCFLLLIEIAIIPTLFYWFLFSVRSTWIVIALCVAVILLDIVLTLYIINSEMNAEYKIAWIVPILLIPPVGALLYLTLRRRPQPRRKLKALAKRFADMECLYTKEGEHTAADAGDFADDEFARSCAEYAEQATWLPPTDCY